MNNNNYSDDDDHFDNIPFYCYDYYDFYQTFFTTIFIKELRFCDCFSESCASILSKIILLRKEKRTRNVVFDFLTYFAAISNPKAIILMGENTVACCADPLFSFDCMPLIDGRQMYRDCETQCFDAGLTNCSYYVDNEVTFENFLFCCARCKSNFIKFVSARFFRLKRECLWR